MPTVRQQILDNLSARLTSIAPGAVFSLPGGQYACTSTVRDCKQWRKNLYSLGELPALAWQDATAQLDDGGCLGQGSRWRLKIIFAAYTSGATAASQARVLLADMLAAVGSDLRCNGLAHWTEPDQERLDLHQAGNIIAGIKLAINIDYTPAMGDSAPPGDNTLTVDGEILTADGDPLTW